MREEDFLDLLKEIDTMSIEEYNIYHKQALKMRESCFYIQDLFANCYRVEKNPAFVIRLTRDE